MVAIKTAQFLVTTISVSIPTVMRMDEKLRLLWDELGNKAAQVAVAVAVAVPVAVAAAVRKNKGPSVSFSDTSPPWSKKTYSRV